MLRNCDYCNDVIDLNQKDTYEIKSTTSDSTITHYACKRCVLNYLKQCEDCGRYFDRYSAPFSVYYAIDRLSSERKYICPDCARQHYTICHSCRALVKNEDTTKVLSDDNSMVRFCKRCISKCVRCSNCYNMIDPKFTYFERVNTEFIPYCANCYSKYNTYEAQYDIKEYHYTPPLNFYTAETSSRTPRNSTIYYGVEWEIDGGGIDSIKAGSIANTIGDDHCWITKDGSLSNGFEIISHPFTINYFNNGFKNRYKNAMELANKMGYLCCNKKGIPAINSSGIHIHISRSGLGSTEDAQMENIYKLWLTMCRFKDRFYKISGRTSQHQVEMYCALPKYTDVYGFKSLNEFKNKDKGAFYELYKINGNKGSRYRALNLVKRDTVEFRLFNSTTNFERFDGYVNFVDTYINVLNKLDIDKINYIQWRGLKKKFINYKPVLEKFFEEVEV